MAFTVTLKEQVSLMLGLGWVLLLTIPHVIVALYYLVFPRPKKDIKNDIVLVTGSGQGLGRELALLFAQQGCEVVCVDIMPDQNLTTVKLIHAQGGKARAYVCNVADRKAVMELGKEVGRVDILVNNAGVYPLRDLWNATEEEIRTIIDINLFSQFWTMQAFLPGMKERNHGHVVCISSMSGLTGLGYAVPYAVSKYGVAGLMTSISQELHNENKKIKLTTVYPYFITTRPEIEEHVHVRVKATDTKTAADCIFQGVLEELDSFTVPRSHMHIANMIRLLPRAFELLILDYFSVKFTAPKVDMFKDMFENSTFKKTGVIKTQVTS